MGTMLWMHPALALALGYLIGSIPFGLLLTRWFGAGDIREIGSGNIGATNVLRTGRTGLAAGTLVLDALKGVSAVLLGEWLGAGLGLLGGLAAFIGHLFPIWLRFKGGKGVATMLGISFALAWPIGLAFALVWLVMMGVTRISSVGGIGAALAAPLAATFSGHAPMAIGLLGMTLILVLRHADNIKRLANGTEPRIGQRTE